LGYYGNEEVMIIIGLAIIINAIATLLLLNQVDKLYCKVRALENQIMLRPKKNKRGT
jgi:hypothetical protein